MTVKDLIERLEQYTPGTEVFTIGACCCCTEFHEVEDKHIGFHQKEGATGIAIAGNYKHDEDGATWAAEFADHADELDWP